MSATRLHGFPVGLGQPVEKATPPSLLFHLFMIVLDTFFFGILQPHPAITSPELAGLFSAYLLRGLSACFVFSSEAKKALQRRNLFRQGG
jgi:hypothetical protein